MYITLLVIIILFFILHKKKETFKNFDFNKIKNINSPVLIIGNSKNILNKKMGKKIDKFDNIIRFNDYKIKGFEDEVGTKTTIHFVNHLNGNKVNFVKNLKNDKFYITYLFKTKRNKSNIKNFKNIKDKYPLEKIYQNAKKYIEKKKIIDKIPHLRLGLIAICSMLYLNKKVIIYGFDTENNTSGEHYQNDRNFNEKVHNNDLERKILKYLIDNNLITILS